MKERGGKIRNLFVKITQKTTAKFAQITEIA